ncbi:MAG: glycosyltransferase family 9 protein [Formosimonas sp.]
MIKNSLILRAPTWIGDTVYCLPVWQRLSEHYELHIVGQGWLPDFLSGFPQWRTYKLPKGVWQRRALYRQIQKQVQHPLASPVNALVFPTSFSSVLAMKLAGLKVLAHAHEGRSFMLTQALNMPPAYASIYQRYWDLGNAFLNDAQPAPQHIHLAVAPNVEEKTLHILHSHGLNKGRYIAVCPFAAGDFDGFDKKWPHFAAWAERMTQLGHLLVCCPAPNEEADWQSKYSTIPALKGLGLAQYAAVLKNAACVVSNDTGPGHMAAAVGVPLISVLNQTVVEMYGAIGPNVHVVQQKGWPSVDDVLTQTLALLAK